MNPLNLIPLPYRLAALALLLAALTAAGGIWLHRDRAQQFAAGEAVVKAQWDAEHAAQLAQAAREAESNAKETQRRLERQGDAQREHDQELAEARLAAASAASAADRLRQRANQYAAAARRAASHPAAGGDGKAGADPAGVLADVLGKAVDRSRFLAAYADAARRAGKQCERDYDALRNAK